MVDSRSQDRRNNIRAATATLAQMISKTQVPLGFRVRRANPRRVVYELLALLAFFSFFSMSYGLGIN